MPVSVQGQGKETIKVRINALHVEVQTQTSFLVGQRLEDQGLQEGEGPSLQSFKTVHKECVYDEEQGEMVEVGNKDEQWLNGHAAMPHERRSSSSGSGELPASLSQVFDHSLAPFRTLKPHRSLSAAKQLRCSRKSLVCLHGGLFFQAQAASG